MIEEYNKNIKFQNSIRSMLNWFLRPESENLSDKGLHNVSLLANHISLSSKMIDYSVGF